MRGQPVLAGDQARLPALHLAGALDRMADEREHVRSAHLRRAGDLRVLGVQERPQLLQRVVLCRVVA
jgi:hypothetical protein